MKKRLLFVLAIFAVITFSVNAQDTITGFNFADTNDVEFNADMGLSGNLTYDIRAEDSTGATRILTYTIGATDYAATATGWNDGADNKAWSIKFKANGYQDFVLYSKQRSGGANPGPKNWKVQCKLSGGTYADVTGGTVTVGNNWTSGVVDSLPLPATINNPGTTSIYVRWIMTDNVNSGSGTVDSAGISKIDDILIIGVSASGAETVIFENNVSVYPNPCNDILNVYSEKEISAVELIDFQGKVVYESTEAFNEKGIDINDFTAGIYMLRVYHNNEAAPVTRKIIVL